MVEQYDLINGKVDFDNREDNETGNWRGHMGKGSADAAGVCISRSWAAPFWGCNVERLVIRPARKTTKGERVKVWLSHAGHLRRRWIEGKAFHVSYESVIERLAALSDDTYHCGPTRIYSLLFEEECDGY